MTAPYKVLIAYDGSPCADAAIVDLQRSGLSDNVEALVLSVADLWLLPQGESETPPPLRPSAAIRQGRIRAAALLAAANAHATEAAKHVQQLFPSWKISSETATNSPAWAITLKAEEWGANLIVVGSHGYSQLGRWLLGSISQSVLTHATCSVRIARSRSTAPDRPLRILVGIDGSIESDLAVRTVANRVWPPGTDIRLMLVLNPSILEEINAESHRKALAGSMAVTPSDVTNEVEELDGMIGRMLESYRAIVQQNPSGATVATTLASGDPKRVLLETAEEWGADSIFIGSRGLNQWERILLGSVSSSVAVRAGCSVEVIRRPRSMPNG